MKTDEKELTNEEAKEIMGGSSILDRIVDAVLDYIRDLAKPTV